MSTPTPTTPPTATPEPLDQHVRRIVARLDAGRREAFEERAAIVEYDAGLPREEAERRALLDVLANLGFPMPVQLLQLEIAGGTQWVLTGDGPTLCAELQAQGAQRILPVPLADTVHTQFADAAYLTTCPT